MSDFYLLWAPATVRALQAEGVTTWEELAGLSAAILLGHPGVGARALENIEQALERQGLQLSGTEWRSRASKPREAKPISDKCGVYFVRCGDFVKIGRATSVRRRILNAQTFCPFPLELVRLEPCATPAESATLEKQFHGQFAAHRYRGEWFHYAGVLRAFLEHQAVA